VKLLHGFVQVLLQADSLVDMLVLRLAYWVWAMAAEILLLQVLLMLVH
jgi:hypothetical protein